MFTNSLLPRLLLLASILLIPIVQAEQISFTQVAIGLEEGVVLLDMVQEYELSETMLEALQSGVPLTFETRLNMRRDGAFPWQGDEVSLQLRRVLRYHPLSSQYEVNDVANQEIQLFATLAAATRALGYIRSQKIISLEELDQEEYYLVEIQTLHRIADLPLPLRPLAYLTPSWHLESRVYEWRLKP